MKKENTLDQVQSIEDEQVILPLAASGHQKVEGCKQPLSDVPFEPFLQLEELAKGWIASEVA